MKLLRDYLSLGVIVGAFPFQIINGQTEDATPVMADFNWLASQVNANAAPLSSVPPFTGIVAWTPGLAFGGSSAGITYNFRNAAYFKIANIVFFSLDVLLTNKGAAAGAATITGLPFTVSSNFPTASAPMVSVVSRNVTFAAGYLAGLIGGGTTSITLINPVTAATFNVLSNAEFANNSEIIITGYFAT